MTKPIVVMICYARSGGTILNKCLVPLEDVAMLSEVNPLGGGWGEKGPESYSTIKNQVKNWYQISLQCEGFSEELLELYEYCTTQNKQIILRDWSYINFSKHTYNNNCPPNEFLIFQAINSKITINSFAFVRNAIDVWISRGTPQLDQFSEEYLNYSKAIVSICSWTILAENLNPDLRIKIEDWRVAIFAKACFGHPSPSKRQKLNATANAFGAPDVLRTCRFATPSYTRRWLRSTPSNDWTAFRM